MTLPDMHPSGIVLAVISWVFIALAAGSIVYAAVLFIRSRHQRRIHPGAAEDLRRSALFAGVMGVGLAAVIAFAANLPALAGIAVGVVSHGSDTVWAFITGLAVALVFVNIVLWIRRFLGRR